MCASAEQLEEALQNLHHGEEGGEEAHPRGEFLVRRDCFAGWEGGINKVHSRQSLWAQRNVCTLTPLPSGAQSLEGLQEVKSCCFTLPAQAHSCHLAEISGACTHFSVKRKVGFILLSIIAKNSAECQRYSTARAWSVDKERQLPKSSHPWGRAMLEAANGNATSFLLAPKHVKKELTGAKCGHVWGWAGWVSPLQSLYIILIPHSTPRRHRRLIPSQGSIWHWSKWIYLCWTLKPNLSNSTGYEKIQRNFLEDRIGGKKKSLQFVILFFVTGGSLSSILSKACRLLHTTAGG